MANILIAEDERDIRDLIEFTLAHIAGHAVTAVANGEDAVRLAAESTPDLILLDLRMPKMNGFEACKALKDDSATRDIPVVFLSAKGMDEEREQGRALGAIDFITKPFAPEDLVRDVEAILQRIGAA